MVRAAGQVCGVCCFSVAWTWFRTWLGVFLHSRGWAFHIASLCPLLLCVGCWLQCLCSLNLACAPRETRVVCVFVPSALQIQGRADEEESWSAAILCALWQLLQASVAAQALDEQRGRERGGSCSQENLNPLSSQSFAGLQIAISVPLFQICCCCRGGSLHSCAMCIAA